MTRKHFELIASALKTGCPSNTERSVEARAARVQWARDVHLIADACQRANPGFQHSRFYRACGLED